MTGNNSKIFLFTYQILFWYTWYSRRYYLSNIHRTLLVMAEQYLVSYLNTVLTIYIYCQFGLSIPIILVGNIKNLLWKITALGMCLMFHIDMWVFQCVGWTNLLFLRPFFVLTCIFIVSKNGLYKEADKTRINKNFAILILNWWLKWKFEHFFDEAA